MKTATNTVSWRFVFALAIGPAAWLMPHQGVIATLLPQRLSDVDPINKVSLVMMFSTIAMLVALVANIVLGACSDRTRSRFGKRSPWIVGCSILSCIVLVAFAYAQSIATMLLWWCVYEIVVNGVAAAMVAQLSDRVPEKWRGTVSSAYGLGLTLGGQAGTLIAAQFLEQVTIGVIFFAGIALIGSLISSLLAAEPANTSEVVRPFTWKQLAEMFMFPTHGARDFYITLAARFLLIVGSSMVSNYMLYILQDYVLLNYDGARHVLSINATIMLITGLICCVVAGPIVDYIGRPKLLITITTGMLALGAIIPFIIPTVLGLVCFSVLSGIAVGANASLIQTISIEVLPNPNDAAKDLGFLNLSNTLGGVGGSFVAATIINTIGYRGVFLVEAIIVVLSTILFRFIQRLQ